MELGLLFQSRDSQIPLVSRDCPEREDGLIYASKVSWSVSALIGFLDLDISHFGVKIMKVTLKRPSTLCKWNLIFKGGKCLREFLCYLEVVQKKKVLEFFFFFCPDYSSFTLP